MPGIAGIIYAEALQVNNLLEIMLNALKHRGPDQSDFYTFHKFQTGICGQKLAYNDDKTIIVGLDGMLYNRKEIWEEIHPQRKFDPNTSSADIIIDAYQAWNDNFLEKLDGDFAFVLFDQLRRRTILGRDRLGKKPLYWFHNAHHFVFASELKAILITGVVPQTPAVDSIAAYLSMGYIPQDMSPIEGINKLLPGHYLVFNANSSKAIHSYWSYSSFFNKQTNDPQSKIILKLDQLLEEAVKNRITSSEPLGCFLSGGLGSASITHYLQKQMDQTDLLGYSIGFKGQNDDDVEAALAVAGSLHLKFNQENITSQNYLDDLVKIGWHLDEPTADMRVPATWRLAQMASKKTKTLFSGMGSEEILACHTRYLLEKAHKSVINQTINVMQPILRTLLLPILKLTWQNGAFNLLKDTRTNPWQAEYLRHNALFSENEIKQAAPHLAGLFDSNVFLNKFHNLANINSPISSFIYFDVKTRLADCYASQYDRITAAHSMDWHAPFFDRHIVEYLASLTDLEKGHYGRDRTTYLKTILHGVYPEWVINRTRKPSRDFMRPWIGNPESKAIFNSLLKGTLVETGLISGDWLKDQIESAEKYQRPFQQLWAILTLEIWFKIFINHPIKPQAPDISLYDLLNEG